MSVRFFHYQDSGAPSLSNVAGSIANIFRACTIGTSGIAYGTGVNEKPAIGGYTMPYDSGNKFVLRSPAGTSQYYMRLDDTGPGAGGVTEARIHGYKTMSDVDTGTGRFPNSTTGSVWRKGATTNRPWWLLGDERTLYFYCHWFGSGTTFGALYWFGEYESLLPGDVNNVCVAGGASENVTGTILDTLLMGSPDNATTARRLATSQFSGSVDSPFRLASIYSSSTHETSVGLIGGAEVYPGNMGGSILRPVYLVENNGTNYGLRGTLRGMYHHAIPLASLASGSTLPGGVDGYPGRTFRISEQMGNGATARPIFDLTGPW